MSRSVMAHMAITEQRNQPIASGVGMAPELGEGLRRDPQVHAPEIERG